MCMCVVTLHCSIKQLVGVYVCGNVGVYVCGNVALFYKAVGWCVCVW